MALSTTSTILFLMVLFGSNFDNSSKKSDRQCFMTSNNTCKAMPTQPEFEQCLVKKDNSPAVQRYQP